MTAGHLDLAPALSGAPLEDALAAAVVLHGRGQGPRTCSSSSWFRSICRTSLSPAGRGGTELVSRSQVTDDREHRIAGEAVAGVRRLLTDVIR